MAGKASVLRDAVGLALLLICTSVLAYVPALPTNSSKEAIAGGLNVTDISKLHLRWYSNGYYSQNVSYQLVGEGSRGISRGVLVHFSEIYANNATPPTIAPWIAMVSCDFNATDASQEEDIFTLARDKGAVAALLYSLYSLACVINSEYADPATFDQVFDIFSTQSYTSAQLIEYQFGQFGHTNETIYGQYDSKRLNDSAELINATIAQGSPTAPGYLFGILQAYNATEQIDEPTGSTNTTEDTNPPKRSQNTALAMIILYAITGCVSVLFIVVIITGAIRAIRHPERYGPRSRNGRGGPGQSRARGLTRAILDTFPIVKFGDRSAQPSNINASDASKDAEAQRDGLSSPAVELHAWQIVDENRDGQHHPSQLKGIGADTAEGTTLDVGQNTTKSTGKRASTEPQRPIFATAESGSRLIETSASTSQQAFPTKEDHTDVVPESMGRETCPICIMDFEEGDDLRLLPCEGKHRFHQSCVDPWLLELSSSCPICRQDFLALENILSGESEQGHGQGNDNDDDLRRMTRPESPSGSGHRFSRYLRFAKRRHQRNRTDDDHDPTDPYMPPVPETSIYPASTSGGRPNPS